MDLRQYDCHSYFGNVILKGNCNYAVDIYLVEGYGIGEFEAHIAIEFLRFLVKFT